MHQNYRDKIKEMVKCLETLDNEEIRPDSMVYIDKSWAALQLAYAQRFDAAPEKHSLVFVESSIDERGNMVLELSKAKMNDDEQVLFDKFMTACKSGEFCSMSDEDSCSERFKQIKNILS